MRRLLVARDAGRNDVGAVVDTAGFKLMEWVLMPDHTHWLLQLCEIEPLDRAVSRLKTINAERINECGRRCGRVWSRAYHDRALRSDEDMVIVARYIVANPLRAGLVQRIGDYPYWNSTWP